MSTAAPPGLMTAEEFYEWANRPENADKWYELDAGRVVEMPSPGKRHGMACGLVARKLSAYLDARGEGYLCTNDTGLIVARGPDTVRGPDLMLYLEHQALEDATPGHADDVPALVVEVMSPSDSMGKTLRRVKQYLGRGVSLVWVIEPEISAVQVFRPNEFPKVLDDSDELTGNGILPDFRCRVSDLFTVPKRA
ncbi:MAG: Uma2 family endonuclease [Zavarzinella sp.]|nr:Uma2 family endonuclease [Zavarzinella sp.]